MKQIWSSIIGWFTAGIAALCCFGFPLIISGLALLGIPFFVSDLFFIPLMVLALGVYLWGMFRTRVVGLNWLLILGSVGSGFAFAGIWITPLVSAFGFVLMMTGFVFQTVFRLRKPNTGIQESPQQQEH